MKNALKQIVKIDETERGIILFQLLYKKMKQKKDKYSKIDEIYTKPTKIVERRIQKIIKSYKSQKINIPTVLIDILRISINQHLITRYLQQKQIMNNTIMNHLLKEGN